MTAHGLPPRVAHVPRRWLGAADPESGPPAFSLARTADASLGAPAAWEALFSCAGYRCTTTTGACSFAGIGATEADAAIRVCAAEAVTIDVVNIPEAGRAGLAFELVLHARDKFGNVDEAFEREVALDQDGNLPPGELTMEHAGVGRRERGRARMLVNRKPPAPGQLISLTGLAPVAALSTADAPALPVRPSFRRNPSQRAV